MAQVTPDDREQQSACSSISVGLHHPVTGRELLSPSFFCGIKVAQPPLKLLLYWNDYYPCIGHFVSLYEKYYSAIL